MAKNGQMNIFGGLFFIVLFVILFGVGLSPIVGVMSTVTVSEGGLTGISGWIMANLVLWILLAFIMMILWTTSK